MKAMLSVLWVGGHSVGQRCTTCGLR